MITHNSTVYEAVHVLVCGERSCTVCGGLKTFRLMIEATAAARRGGPTKHLHLLAVIMFHTARLIYNRPAQNIPQRYITYVNGI